MHNESTAFIDSDRPSRARTDTTDAPGALDWQSFSTRYCPGRRRHDLEAIGACVSRKNRPVKVEGRRPGASSIAALASSSLLAFTSLGILHQLLLTQLLGSRCFRCGQRPGRWSAPEAETLEKDTQAFHA
jgi:hypothetical protein